MEIGAEITRSAPYQTRSAGDGDAAPEMGTPRWIWIWENPDHVGEEEIYAVAQKERETKEEQIWKSAIDLEQDQPHCSNTM